MPHRRPRLLAVLPVAALSAAALAACGGGGDATQGSQRAGYDVTIAGYAFAPTPLTVDPGQTVKVVNSDQAVHDLTSDTKGLFTTTALTKDADGTFTAPKTAGTYTYTCSFHLDMHGSLVVR